MTGRNFLSFVEHNVILNAPTYRFGDTCTSITTTKPQPPPSTHRAVSGRPAARPVHRRQGLTAALQS